MPWQDLEQDLAEEFGQEGLDKADWAFFRDIDRTLKGSVIRDGKWADPEFRKAYYRRLYVEQAELRKAYAKERYAQKGKAYDAEAKQAYYQRNREARLAYAKANYRRRVASSSPP